MLGIIRILASPLTLVYSLIVRFRNFLFDKNIFKVKKVPVKVVSIGNITVGGSGKTPAVIYLANILKNKKIKVGVLSRGYRRNSKGYLFVSDGQKIFTKVNECGDEIYFVADELKVPAAVSENRVKGAKKFIKDAQLDMIILDDGFQHRWIYRDLDILIIDQRFLIKEEQTEQNLLPLGLMREPFDSLKRADVIILNRKFSEKKEIPAKIKKYFESKPVFNGYYTAEGIYDVKTHHYYNIQDFVGQKSLVVCGIAKPYSFLRVLEKNNIDFTNKMLFPDHKNYTLKEIQQIRKKFYQTNAYSVLTTQKDAVKFINFARELDDIDIYYLKIKLNLEENNEFEKLLLKTLNKF
ncbi:tetraacyldisaccharide 4'-kinase [Melioribacteraceae bacterium 4301-Me]|uniref:tetraacyldisaccharide 4'-kinase n=1 Tax=Pyranulibacter aquaticus TaxID=3163344 RepID=UPI003595009B